MATFKDWKTVLLLSIVVPISLLAALRVVGVLRGPWTVSQTKTLEEISWGVEKPDRGVYLMDNLTSFYHEKHISLNCSILIFDYDHDDNLLFRVNTTAATSIGFVNSINITFQEEYPKSTVWFFNLHDPYEYSARIENLSIARYESWQRSGLKCFLQLTGANHSRSVHFDGLVEWTLRSPVNQTSLMEANIEFIQFNGTAYNKIVQSFLLRLVSDNDNTPDTATLIESNDYSNPNITMYDSSDFYKINVSQGQVVSISATTMAILNYRPHLYLFLYDPQITLKNSTDLSYDGSITYMADSSGYWFIEIRPFYTDYGFYSLSVKLHDRNG